MQRLVAIFYLLFCIVSSLGPVNPFDITDASGDNSSFLTLAIQGPFIVLLMFTEKVKSKVINDQNLLLWLFVCCYAISSVALADGDIPRSFYIHLVKLALCILLINKLPWYLKSRQKLMAYGFILFAAISVIIAGLYYWGYLDNYSYMNKGRLILFFENANAYSARMVISMFFIAYLMVQNPLKWRKWRYSLVAIEALLFYIVLASGSRGSLIIMSIGFFVYLIYMPMRSRVLKGCILLTVIAIAIAETTYVLHNDKDISIMERMTDTIESGNDAGRSELSNATLQIWQENPIFGVGALEFSRQMFWRFRFSLTVHNLYWYVLVTTGVVGFIIFMTFLSILGYKVIKVRSQEPMALVLYIAMLLIASKTGGALAYIIMWYVFSIAETFSLKCLKK